VDGMYFEETMCSGSTNYAPIMPPVAGGPSEEECALLSCPLIPQDIGHKARLEIARAHYLTGASHLCDRHPFVPPPLCHGLCRIELDCPNHLSNNSAPIDNRSRL
jgi:hypothetical protein